MSNQFSLEQIDVEGTVRTAAEDAGAAVDRRDVLRRGALVGAGAIGATTLFGSFLSPAEAAIEPHGQSQSPVDAAIVGIVASVPVA